MKTKKKIPTPTKRVLRHTAGKQVLSGGIGKISDSFLFTDTRQDETENANFPASGEISQGCKNSCHTVVVRADIVVSGHSTWLILYLGYKKIIPSFVLNRN